MQLPIRRVVTGHDKQGTAVFAFDDTYETVIIPSGDAAMATIWTTATVPADLNDDTDGRERVVLLFVWWISCPARLLPCIVQTALIME
jgi:hypothetical protein